MRRPARQKIEMITELRDAAGVIVEISAETTAGGQVPVSLPIEAPCDAAVSQQAALCTGWAIRSR